MGREAFHDRGVGYKHFMTRGPVPSSDVMERHEARNVLLKIKNRPRPSCDMTESCGGRGARGQTSSRCPCILPAFINWKPLAHFSSVLYHGFQVSASGTPPVQEKKIGPTNGPDRTQPRPDQTHTRPPSDPARRPDRTQLAQTQPRPGSDMAKEKAFGPFLAENLSDGPHWTL